MHGTVVDVFQCPLDVVAPLLLVQLLLRFAVLADRTMIGVPTLFLSGFPLWRR